MVNNRAALRRHPFLDPMVADMHGSVLLVENSLHPTVHLSIFGIGTATHFFAMSGCLAFENPQVFGRSLVVIVLEGK